MSNHANSVALITAAGSLALAVIGAFIAEFNKRRYKIWETTLAMCDEQIGRLYAPLTNLVEQLDTTDDIKKEMVKQDPQHEAEISQVFYNNYFTPIHQKIANLLETQLHLLEDKTIPKSFEDYYAHVASERVMFSLFSILDQAKQAGRIAQDSPQIKVSPRPYPEPYFEEDIARGFRIIQMRQERMLNNIRSRNAIRKDDIKA